MSEANMDIDLWKRRETVKVDGRWTVEGRPPVSREVKTVQTPSNIPGQTLISLLVTAPPHSATPPHNHNGAALVAQVIKGRVISQMIHEHKITKPDGSVETTTEDSGVGVYGPGDVWYEAPGCHHVRSENPFDEEAQFFANFIIDSKTLAAAKTPEAALVVYDADAN